MQEVLTYDEVDWKWGVMIVVARGRIRVRPWAWVKIVDPNFSPHRSSFSLVERG
jgi:hypothetical protein